MINCPHCGKPIVDEKGEGWFDHQYLDGKVDKLCHHCGKILPWEIVSKIPTKIKIGYGRK